VRSESSGKEKKRDWKDDARGAAEEEEGASDSEPEEWNKSSMEDLRTSNTESKKILSSEIS
jgi:hypothetical protein